MQFHQISTSILSYAFFLFTTHYINFFFEYNYSPIFLWEEQNYSIRYIISFVVCFIYVNLYCSGAFVILVFILQDASLHLPCTALYIAVRVLDGNS